MKLTSTLCLMVSDIKARYENCHIWLKTTYAIFLPHAHRQSFKCCTCTLTPAREGGEGRIGAVVSELQADHSTFLIGIELQPTGPEAYC